MLTLPNILTLSRILAVPGLVALLWWPQWHLGYFIGWCVYSLMGITDYFDGYLARTQGTVSKLGQFLDPIADKIMIASVILVLTAKGMIRDIHVVAALVILLREIAVSGLREFLAGLRVSMPVSTLAKWKTTLQILAFGSFILAGGTPNWYVPGTHDNLPELVGLITLWGAALLTLMTGWDYLRVGLKHMD
jgi:CDP-diacylglycerol--glycerol-3-phosphate 3-phosphatidyltransferase/cardiolipin synthase